LVVIKKDANGDLIADFLPDIEIDGIHYKTVDDQGKLIKPNLIVFSLYSLLDRLKSGQVAFILTNALKHSSRIIPPASNVLSGISNVGRG